MNLIVEDWGTVSYQQAYKRQHELVQLLRDDHEHPGVCLVLEHNPVFTIGRNGSVDHVAVSKDHLERREIELIRVERGGEVTYHGPGQLVCYPIVNLRRMGLSVVDFVRNLEQVMLNVVYGWGISAGRDDRNHGIWQDGRKLGSIGIAIKHSITYHGLALNVDIDLEPFSWVNPCGLAGVTMTSMSRELNQPVDVMDVKQRMVSEIGTLFDCEILMRPPYLSPAKQSKSISTGKPKWLKKKLPTGTGYESTRRLVANSSLHTVCQEARCPNQFECYGKGTATFMIMGDRCTRNCGFCAVHGGGLEPLDPDEPGRIAAATVDMGLDYVVLTSVTRDDLADGGADHFRRTIQAVRDLRPETLVEVLIPDFKGDEKALVVVCQANPAVLNHNVETVARLYSEVRPQAGYRRSLELLERVKQISPDIVTKSGLMVGLGETSEEIVQAMADIKETGCELLTIGQYLQPTSGHLPVKRFVPPREFEELQKRALDIGFRAVASGPHVRSSYRAGHLYRQARMDETVACRPDSRC